MNWVNWNIKYLEGLLFCFVFFRGRVRCRVFSVWGMIGRNIGYLIITLISGEGAKECTIAAPSRRLFQKRNSKQQRACVSSSLFYYDMIFEQVQSVFSQYSNSCSSVGSSFCFWLRDTYRLLIFLVRRVRWGWLGLILAGSVAVTDRQTDRAF